MKIIVGLGNPGEKYKNTRHNVGFMAVSYLQENLDEFSAFSFNKKAEAEIAESIIDNEAINIEKGLLVKPQTFMNSSGQAVQYLVNFYKLNPVRDLLLIYDDLDLPLGDLRASGTSAGGHNGVQSIFDALGTKDIKRIRIGIQGKPRAEIKDTASYVLQNFRVEEIKTIELALKNIVGVAKEFLAG